MIGIILQRYNLIKYKVASTIAGTMLMSTNKFYLACYKGNSFIDVLISLKKMILFCLKMKIIISAKYYDDFFFISIHLVSIKDSCDLSYYYFKSEIIYTLVFDKIISFHTHYTVQHVIELRIYRWTGDKILFLTIKSYETHVNGINLYVYYESLGAKKKTN